MKKAILLTMISFLPVFLLAQEIITLYDNGHVPDAKAGLDCSKTIMPTLTLYRPDKKLATGIAVIICSGGSYGRTADLEEGIPAAESLSTAGITAFLLDYRVPNAMQMEDQSTGPLMDAQKAIQYVREHAASYRISADKIGIMGFSAGGHLVSTAGTHFSKSYIDNPGQTSLRPDFMILIYPVISMADSLTHLRSRRNLLGPDPGPEKIREYSNERQVTDQTPPTYLVAAVDDTVVKVQNSLYFSAALRQHHIPTQLFLYAKGGHGFGIHNDSAETQWMEDCIRWIKRTPAK
jgi:acetyl esterase/lipase